MSDTRPAYKFLNGREATHVPGFRYHLRRWTPPVEGDLVPCLNGYHLLRAEHVARWIARDLFVAEWDGEMIVSRDKLVVRRARIVEHLRGWNERTARLAAADFAEAVLPIFENVWPGDDRPRLAIQAARDHANGLIGAADAAAAGAAARCAAGVIPPDTYPVQSRAADAAWAAGAAVGREGGAAAAAAAGAAARAAVWDYEVAAEMAEQGQTILDYAHGHRG